jgi:hypothetical protein
MRRRAVIAVTLVTLSVVLCSVALGGSVWTRLDGLEGNDVRVLYVVPGRLYAGGDGPTGVGAGVWRLDLSAPVNGWESLGPAHAEVRSILLLNGDSDHLLIGVHPTPWDTTRIYRSEDGGSTWVQSDYGTCDWTIRVLRADPDRPGRILAGGTGLFESLDGGHTWQFMFSSSPFFCSGSFFVHDVRFTPFDPLAIWLVANTAFETGELWQSTDDGTNWEFRHDEYAVGLWDWLQLHPTDPAVLYGTAGARFFRLREPAFEPEILHDAGPRLSRQGYVHPIDSTKLYVGEYGDDPTSNAFLFSPDDGATWIPIGEEDTPRGGVLRWIERDAENPDRFYIAFESDGVWVAEAPVVEVSGGQAAKQALAMHLVPNPASGAVRIQIGATEASEITLSVFDVTGRLVKRLLQGGAAPTQLVWDGTGVDGEPMTDGTYFVRLEAGDEVLTTKATLAR